MFGCLDVWMFGCLDDRSLNKLKIIESNDSCAKEIIGCLHRKVIIPTYVKNLLDFYNHLIKIKLGWNCKCKSYSIERSPLLRNVSKYMY